MGTGEKFLPPIVKENLPYQVKNPVRNLKNFFAKFGSEQVNTDVSMGMKTALLVAEIMGLQNRLGDTGDQQGRAPDPQTQWALDALKAFQEPIKDFKTLCESTKNAQVERAYNDLKLSYGRLGIVKTTVRPLLGAEFDFIKEVADISGGEEETVKNLEILRQFFLTLNLKKYVDKKFKSLDSLNESLEGLRRSLLKKLDSE